jgi:hypothetical protein
MEDLSTASEPVRPMSFTDKITNVIASPGELFENVRLTGKTTSNWLIPWIIFVVVGIILGQLMLNNPSLTDQLGQMIRKGMEKSVQEGKMTQEQMDRAYEIARPGSTWFRLAQTGGLAIVSFVLVFVLGLIYWLLGKSAMKATAPYMKVVEIVGLTLFIGMLEQVVTTLLMFALDSIHATPSLGIFVSDFDMDNKIHVALSKVNAFTLWSLSVTSIGLSKLFQRDFPKVLVLVLALWLIWSIVSLFAGIRLTG